MWTNVTPGNRPLSLIFPKLVDGEYVFPLLGYWVINADEVVVKQVWLNSIPIDNLRAIYTFPVMVNPMEAFAFEINLVQPQPQQ